ncbi:type II CRISPR-associated endonuclease Cas1 [Desulfovibrio cuneatus]|uniref:type II CRISPR-associated endonuclease Cas1 n=1 Tax=Desulfovibrio cuneatus TaxID=159728 RepID=UPI00042025ED|nr:type II CRISPR-associated endonuclease Cas1 [Desulfovibrio cuneatus]
MIIEVSEEGRYIHAERGFVVVQEKGTELGRIPIDTITAFIISAQGATLTKSFLSRLGALNIPVIICGEQYAPISIATPITVHYQQQAIAHAQVGASVALKNNLWQTIVQAKLRNQAAVLRQHAPHASKVAERIEVFSQKVKPGDSDNYEANAARLYWPALLGKGFVREASAAGTNAFLNYAYAVVRACMVRALCAAGLLPLFGVHHCNRLNAFCLADDLMEPLRPFADALVAPLVAGIAEPELTPKNKRILCSLTDQKVAMLQRTNYFIPATYLMAQTLAASFTEGAIKLALPAFPAGPKAI